MLQAVTPEEARGLFEKDGKTDMVVETLAKVIVPSYCCKGNAKEAVSASEAHAVGQDLRTQESTGFRKNPRTETSTLRSGQVCVSVGLLRPSDFKHLGI